MPYNREAKLPMLLSVTKQYSYVVSSVLQYLQRSYVVLSISPPPGIAYHTLLSRSRLVYMCCSRTRHEQHLSSLLTTTAFLSKPLAAPSLLHLLFLCSCVSHVPSPPSASAPLSSFLLCSCVSHPDPPPPCPPLSLLHRPNGHQPTASYDIEARPSERSAASYLVTHPSTILQCTLVP